MELEALASQAVLTHDGQVARAHDDAMEMEAAIKTYQIPSSEVTSPQTESEGEEGHLIIASQEKEPKDNSQAEAEIHPSLPAKSNISAEEEQQDQE